mgnify:CR=1 FL=1
MGSLSIRDGDDGPATVAQGEHRDELALEPFLRRLRAVRQVAQHRAAVRGEPFEVFFPEDDRAGVIWSTTLKKDLRKDQAQALGEIYRKLEVDSRAELAARFAALEPGEELP